MVQEGQVYAETKQFPRCEPVLYRLPEVLVARVLIVVEGEKDVERLIKMGLLEGWEATCNPMGAGKWRSEYNHVFKGKEVIIFPDNDKPGHEHAQVHLILAQDLGYCDCSEILK